MMYGAGMPCGGLEKRILVCPYGGIIARRRFLLAGVILCNILWVCMYVVISISFRGRYAGNPMQRRVDLWLVLFSSSTVSILAQKRSYNSMRRGTYRIKNPYRMGRARVERRWIRSSSEKIKFMCYVGFFAFPLIGASCKPHKIYTWPLLRSARSC